MERMTMDLTRDEARLLAEHLKIYLKHLDAELARTERYQLQHALAREARVLESIFQRLDDAVAAATTPSGVAPARP
jgi:hypothetical protein